MLRIGSYSDTTQWWALAKGEAWGAQHPAHASSSRTAFHLEQLSPLNTGARRRGTMSVISLCIRTQSRIAFERFEKTFA